MSLTPPNTPATIDLHAGVESWFGPSPGAAPAVAEVDDMYGWDAADGGAGDPDPGLQFFQGRSGKAFVS